VVLRVEGAPGSVVCRSVVTGLFQQLIDAQNRMKSDLKDMRADLEGMKAGMKAERDLIMEAMKELQSEFAKSDDDFDAVVAILKRSLGRSNT
jgi:hypothetical protein